MARAHRSDHAAGPDPESVERPQSPSRQRPPTTGRKLVRATIYLLLAVVLGVASVASITNLYIAIPLFIPCWFFLRAGLRHFKTRHSGAEGVEASLGGKPPVLYLRPFGEDDGADGADPFYLYDPWTWRKFPLSPSNLRAIYLQMTGRSSFEQVLAYYVRGIGPLVAVGEPHSAPILGAVNFYVGDAQWQEQVIEVADRSALVVLTAGLTEGVLWEVSTIVRRVRPECFMLNIPGRSASTRRALYQAFRQQTDGMFQSGLPADIGGRRFLRFDAQWRPVMDKPSRPKRHSPAWIERRMVQTLR